MSNNPNRCPHCWSSLPEARPEFCPHCHRSLAVKEKRNWRNKGAATPPPVPPAVPAPAAPAAPAVEYAPYEPPAHDEPPAPQADDPPDTWFYEPPAPQAYEPPAPQASWSAPEAASAAAPAPGAVAVLERDPVEFPGQPLPDNFFAALPERAKRAPLKISRKLVVLGVIGVSAGVSAIGGWADHNDAIASPARHLVAGACADYRDFTTRLDNNRDDVTAFQDGVVWFQNNRDRFVEAARLDPELQGATDFVVWFDDLIDSGFAGADGITDEEIDAREEPLNQACYAGAGRA